MFSYKRILVPVDFSSGSRSALSYAIRLAAEFGANLDILHVWEPPQYVGPDVMLHLPGDSKSLSDYVMEEARQELDDLLRDLDPPTSLEITTMLESGDTRNRIIELTKTARYDLVVMGTHGRTGLSRLFLGSVAEHVIRKAECPVLTVRT